MTSILYLSKTALISPETHSLSILNFCYACADRGKIIFLSCPVKNNHTESFIKNHYGIKSNIDILRPIRYRNSFSFGVFGKILMWLFLAFEFRRVTLNYKPKIVYSRLAMLELYFLPRSQKLYYEMHSFGLSEKSFIFKIYFKYFLSKRVDRFIVTTDLLKGRLLSKYPWINDIVVAPLSAPEPCETCSMDWTPYDELLAKHRGKVLGYTGFMDKDMRGVDTMVNIATSKPEFLLLIAGGPEDAVRHWKGVCKDRGIENIIFLGWVPQEFVNEVIRRCDAVLSPLKYRPVARAPDGQNMSPLKVPFYMSHGKVIIASDIPSHQHYISHDVNGLLAEAECVADWCEKISYALKPDTKLRISGNARREYESRYTEDARIKRIFTYEN